MRGDDKRLFWEIYAAIFDDAAPDTLMMIYITGQRRHMPVERGLSPPHSEDTQIIIIIYDAMLKLRRQAEDAAAAAALIIIISHI